MGVGRGADTTASMSAGFLDRVDGATSAPYCAGDRLGRRRHGVGDGDEPGLALTVIAGVDLADAPRAEQSRNGQSCETSCSK